LTGPEQGHWLERLEREHDNLRAALHEERRRKAVIQGLRLAASLGRFWEVRSHLREGKGWLRDLLTLAAGAPGPVPAEVRASALQVEGVLTARLGDPMGAVQLLEASLALWRDQEEWSAAASTLGSMGGAWVKLGNAAQARANYEESLALYRQNGNERGIGIALGNLATLADEAQEYDHAISLYEEAVAIGRRLGDAGPLAVTLANMGMSLTERGEYARAAQMLEESLALHRQLKNRRGQAVTLLGLGDLRLEEGDTSRAVALMHEGIVLAWEVGDRYWVASYLEQMAWVEHAQGRYERSTVLLGAASAQWEALRVQPFSPSRHEQVLGLLRAALGDVHFAAAWTKGAATPVEQFVAACR
jgi:tetratricopeptide (TPR) repeat protein